MTHLVFTLVALATPYLLLALPLLIIGGIIWLIDHYRTGARRGG